MNKETKQQILRFVIVGAIATAIQYAVYFFICLVSHTRLWLNLAMTVGYVVSMVCNFYLTTYFTFRSKASVRRATGFGVSHAVNYTLQILFFNFFSLLGVHRLVAPILAMSLAVPVNFMILRYVYKDRS